ncbi:MAG: type II toxin-antitoxin system RelE family toxin [Balneola sp.]
MKVEFLRKFYKDLDKIKRPKDNAAILEIIDSTKEVASISELPSTKKLVGFANAYRIRVGDLRIGVLLEGDTVIFVRVANRKDIYRIFP